MQSLRAFLFFVAVRLLSVFAVRTWFVPDEYWQSLEVGHHLAFGYGHLTWEWKQGIRSYFQPLCIAGLYKTLALLDLDTVALLTLLPRIGQALLSATADYRFYRWSNNSKWSGFLVAIAWFWFYVGSRTLSNTLETSLSTIALSLFPWRRSSTERCSFLWLVAALVFIRPTAVVPWLPLCVHHLRLSRFSVVELLLKRYLPIGLAVAGASVALDSLARGELIVTAWQFARLNVGQGIGSFYGTHSPHWYVSQGLPTVLGITAVPFLLAAIDTVRHWRAFTERSVLLVSVAFTALVFSALPHKELRFVLPVLPMCLFVTGDYLARWSRKASRLAVWLVALVLLAGNVAPAAYFGWVHQSGTTGVMAPLADIARDYAGTEGVAPRAKFLFLMPCHSTPYYSHVHRNVTMRFLPCEPNLQQTGRHVDVADEFYKAPAAWLRSHLPVHPVSALPTHVILFDVLEEHVRDFLAANYRRLLAIEHAPLAEYAGDARVGKEVLVYEIVGKKAAPVADRADDANGDGEL